MQPASAQPGSSTGASAPLLPDQFSPRIATVFTWYVTRKLIPGTFHAARIVTAGGWNSVRQLAPWAAKHRALPVLRRLDDQFARVADDHRGGGRPGLR